MRFFPPHLWWSIYVQVLSSQLPWLDLNCSARENDHRYSSHALGSPLSPKIVDQFNRGGHQHRRTYHLRRQLFTDSARLAPHLTRRQVLRSQTSGNAPQEAGAQKHETRRTLPAALRDVILELNPADSALYAEALRLLTADERRLTIDQQSSLLL